jgi:hypothetical protein
MSSKRHGPVAGTLFERTTVRTCLSDGDVCAAIRFGLSLPKGRGYLAGPSVRPPRHRSRREREDLLREVLFFVDHRSFR